jgi:F-type H+-transporting ATPase subunit b
MLIDWFTVVAQALNFLVLVWLLKRYLYKPVLAAIDAREKQIALAVAAAASQRTAAEQERAALAAEKAALDGESSDLLKRAAVAADAQRARLLADARAEANDLRVKQMATLRDDQTRLLESIANLVQQEVLAIARKVLADLAGASLEQRIAAVFVQRLATLDASAKEALAAALGGVPGPRVRSAFDLGEAQRALIQSAFAEEFHSSIALRFEVSTDTLCGVELLVGGEKLAWSMADYLDGLEQKLAASSVPAGAAVRIPSRPASRAAAAVATP